MLMGSNFWPVFLDMSREEAFLPPGVFWSQRGLGNLLPDWMWWLIRAVNGSSWVPSAPCHLSSVWIMNHLGWRTTLRSPNPTPTHSIVPTDRVPECHIPMVLEQLYGWWPSPNLPMQPMLTTLLEMKLFLIPNPLACLKSRVILLLAPFSDVKGGCFQWNNCIFRARTALKLQQKKHFFKKLPLELYQ